MSVKNFDGGLSRGEGGIKNRVENDWEGVLLGYQQLYSSWLLNSFLTLVFYRQTDQRKLILSPPKTTKKLLFFCYLYQMFFSRYKAQKVQHRREQHRRASEKGSKKLSLFYIM